MIETCAGITASALISAAGTTLTETVRAAFSAKAPDSFRISEKTLASWQPQAKRPAPLSRAEILQEAISTQLTSAMSQRKEPHDLPQRIYLATTVGTIDLLEQDLDAPDCVEYLRQAVIRRWNCTDVRVVSAACASGQLAATLATRAVLNGEVSAALALGLDIDSEFVTSGFKALGAVTPERIRPYDSQRQGMLLGEGAAGLLIANVQDCHCPRLIGWGESCDAAHITAPDLKGENLATAICSALELAGLSPADIGGVIGHGTGTLYNDQAEIAALHRVFGTRPLPLFSLKGITGHTIGAAGAMQLAVAGDILKQRFMPPQAGLRIPMAGAEQYVSKQAQPLATPYLLSLNVGFGGLNSAVIVQGEATDCTPSIPTLDAASRLQITNRISPLSSGPVKILSSATVQDNTATTLSGDVLGPFTSLNEMRQAIEREYPFPPRDLEDYRRGSGAVRHALLAAIMTAATSPDWHPENTAVLGFNGAGCMSNNRAYWKDYLDNGRTSGRGSLFVATLPSTPICEVAIALGIHGPVAYLCGSPDQEWFLKECRAWCSHNRLAQVLAVSCTDSSATAQLLRFE